MRSADGVVAQGTSAMSKQEKDIFNAQFIDYAGDQRGTIVKQILRDVSTSNATHDEQVKISGIGTDPAKLLSEVKNSTKYRVDIVMDEKEGIVTEIQINAAGGSSSGGGTTTP